MVEPSLADRSNNFAEGSTVRVHTTTLDAEVERLGRHPSLIKIDVQGYEREVLAGATKTLSSGYVPVIGTELIFSGLYSNQTTPEEIMATMKNYGYKLWSIDRLVRAQPGYLYFGDATFVSPEVWRIAGGI